MAGSSRGFNIQGELSTLSLGLGIRQAWIYSVVFGTAFIFQGSAVDLTSDVFLSSATTVVLISIGAFSGSLIFAALTDQIFLKIYTSKRAVISAAVLSAVGTFMIFTATASDAANIVLIVFSGLATGVGSAFLLIFWGIAFSRSNASSIVMNATIAIILGVILYSIILFAIPPPFSGILVAVLPIIELALLWELTPVSYAVRKAVPIFNPLPVNKGRYSLKFGIPLLLLGFSIGVLRSGSIQIAIPILNRMELLLALFAGGAITAVLLMTAFSMDKRSHWDSLFRPVILFIAATLFFLPSLIRGDSEIAPMVLLAGYMCFEAVIWVMLAELSQQFRLSPVYVFGIGRGILALGSIFGLIFIKNPGLISSTSYFGEAGISAVTMFVLIAGYTLLPRVRDIRRSVSHRSDNSENWVPGDVLSDSTPINESDDLKLKSSPEESQETTDAQPSECETEKNENELPDKTGWFKSQCENIADRYLLSQRETEVMLLLARGHNAAYIQEVLYISKSTVKTHISRIYRKLEIHSQQELLIMIEKARGNKKNTILR